MRGLLAEAKPACVLEDLANRQLGQNSHGQHHPADDFVGQHTTALIGSAGVRKHLANGLGRIIFSSPVNRSKTRPVASGGSVHCPGCIVVTASLVPCWFPNPR